MGRIGRSYRLGNAALEMTIVLATVPALFALLGVWLNAYVQLRFQRAREEFQVTVEALKHERDRVDRERVEALERFKDAHKLLSKIAREFSITNFDILWRSK